MANAKCLITKGKNTLAHGQWLVSHGYAVEETAEHFVVECSELITAPVTITVEALREIIARKAMISYKAKRTMPDGKVYFGVMGLSLLGQASALVAKPVAQAPVKVDNPFNVL
jgi:hypothetical protein